MLREQRRDGPTAGGGVYSVVRWDDETGDADIFEYDSAGGLLARREWRLFPGRAGADVVGEVVSFDAHGAEIGRRPLKTGPTGGLPPK